MKTIFFKGIYDQDALAQLVLKEDPKGPKRTIVEGVQVIEGHNEEVDGQTTWIDSMLTFPQSFDGKIESDVIQDIC